MLPTLPNGGSREVQSVSESEICVFCHTPHGGQVNATGPIWNRQLSGATYVPYSSASIEALDLGQPGGSSRLCLSCHDGTMAVGAVNVLRGTYTDKNPNTAEIAMSGVAVDGRMPTGEGINSGYTRRLGTDLTNDHPISLTYDATLALNDGEMRDPTDSAHAPTVSTRVPGSPAPLIPLENGQVQCASCHDPHIRDTDLTNTVSIKFLRLNRFQTNSDPFEGDLTFNEANDIICMACHDKAGWAGSAHAHQGVANEVYTNAAAREREFATGTQVWESSCLACHDTHTVQGARRLTRGGVDSSGSPAIEETCYACHSADGGVLRANTQVPDIKTDFALPYKMPIRTVDQDRNFEVHNIGTGGASEGSQRGKDFVEDPALTGHGNRHAECTDCHNPHRVVKERRFNADPAVPAAAGTHLHSNTVMHNNIASGVLKGISGVEPVYGSAAFGSNPPAFELKKGNPAVGASTAVSSPYVTREYQVCFKCHSNYSYGINPPMLGASTPPYLANMVPSSMTQYTNQAMEYQSPTAHMGEGQSLGVEAGAGASWNANNHRSWHPVMAPTGRTEGVRGGAGAIFVAPWNQVGAMGNQTMYCTDCHGSSTGTSATVVPTGGEDGRPWGPHGSENPFILKGTWTKTSGTGDMDTLCFKCHDYDQYANQTNTTPQMSGFRAVTSYGSGSSCVPNDNVNLHIGHARAIGRLRCTWCHIAVPHGWKNKALLVNLRDVGPEVGLPAGTDLSFWGGPGVTIPPYYAEARLGIESFASSGNWLPGNCGGGDRTGINWMSGPCANPP